MIRRAPEALISAARMDPERRDLYVEGISDKLILEYLLNGSIHKNVRILPIDLAVEINLADGGAKGRVLAFASFAENKGIQNLRFLADSDLDALFNDEYPSNTFLTDFPDMEGYVISERNLDKLLKVAHVREYPSVKNLHEALLSISSELGLLRFISRRFSLGLSITNTKKLKSISIDSNLPVLDFKRLITTVCHNTSEKQYNADELLFKTEQAREEFEKASQSQRIRGKDYIELMSITLRKLKLSKSEEGSTLLATMHEENTLKFPRMGNLATFLTQTS